MWQAIGIKSSIHPSVKHWKSKKNEKNVTKKYSKTAKVSFILGCDGKCGHFGYDMANWNLGMVKVNFLSSA